MYVNVKKCKYMCFTRLSDFYTMNGAVLEPVNFFNYLGIIFSCKLDFRNHITQTVSKATCILRFIKRWAKELSDPYVTKQLFAIWFAQFLNMNLKYEALNTL